MPCDYSVRVEMNVDAVSGGRPRRAGLRKFIVEFDSEGEALRIKEIVQQHRPAGLRHSNYWNAKAHPRVGLAERVIAAAHAKQHAEDLATRATP
jgi:hypothetical protein